MAVYGGFEPGGYQAWSLNLPQSVFGSPGIARGMQVTQNSPAGMTVLVTLDGTALDGVCYLPLGQWLRIDTQQTLSIASNSSGQTRTDAVVAQVDPTGSAPTSLSVVQNWATGMGTGGNNNQLVIALISVANAASSIVNGNITMNSATAKLGNAGGASNSMVDPDGIGLKVQDNSATSTLNVVLTGLTTGLGRAVAIQATNVSAVNQVYTFDESGYFLGPYLVSTSALIFDHVSIAGEAPNSVRIIATSSGAGANAAQLTLSNPTGGATAFAMKNGTPFFDQNGGLGGAPYAVISGNVSVGGILTVTGSASFNSPFLATSALIGGLTLTGVGTALVVNNNANIGTLTVSSGTITGINGASLNVGGAGLGDVHLRTGAGNWVYFDSDTSSHVTNLGNFISPLGQLAALASNGGGSAGQRIWEGTTDPGASAGEGDLWVDA